MLANKLQAAIAGAGGEETDEYFKQTTLLLKGDTVDPDLSYNAFSDASSNEFPIAPVGNPYGTSFSPYNSTYSNYFDGSGDYLTIATVWGLSADFTVECWVNYNSLATPGGMLISSINSSGYGSWCLYYNTSSNVLRIVGTDSAIYIDSPTVSSGDRPVIGKWHHIAVSRSGSTVYWFIDGKLIGSTTNSTNWSGTTTSSTYIGTIDGSTQPLNGYISNLRIVRGRAVYTSAFTPPTSPLGATSGGEYPPQGTETSLLTCQSNRFKDNSSNGYTVTAGGNTKVSGFIPFTDTDTTTGSGYFDGSGDALMIADNSAWYFTGDFTVDCWVYWSNTSSAEANVIAQHRPADSSNQAFEIWSNYGDLYFVYGTTYVQTTITAGRWYYISMSVVSGTANCYVNETRINTFSMPSRVNSADPLTIGSRTGSGGSGTTGYFPGYISNARVINGTGLYSNSTITVPTSPLTAVTNTQLLTLQTRGANQNFGFLDSTKQNTITAYGNATQGTFSPFSQPDGYWSNYSPSSAYFYTASSSALNLGSGSFTLEFWVNPSALTNEARLVTVEGSSTIGVIMGGGGAGGSNTDIQVNYFGTATLLTASSVLSVGSWVHVAITYDGTTSTIWVNGVSKDTYSGNVFPNSNSSVTVFGSVNYSNSAFTGYISNLRIVKGTAVYTSAFTPSTEPLTAISNTALLTCQSNRFVDNSTNALSFTLSGTPSVQSFGPFAPTAAYDPAVNGGSGYFDGSGDYITAEDNALYELSNNSFTAEAWVYITGSTGVYHAILTKGGGGSSTDYSWQLDIETNGYAFASMWSNGDGSGNFGTLTGNTNLVDRAWHHIAYVRDGSNFALFVDGVRQASTTSTATASNTSAKLAVGATKGTSAENPLTGYVSDARLVNGVAMYDPTQTTCTVPAAPLSTTANTVFLCNFTNAGIIDYTARNNLETVGNAEVSTAVEKYGTGSLYFDGSGDYLLVPSSPNSAFGSGDYTIEFWVYFSAINSNNTIFDGRTASLQAVPAIIYYSGLGWYYFVNNSTLVSGGSASTSTWYHVAVCRSGTSTKMFINGSQIGSTATDTNTYVASPLTIGARYDNTENLNGYFDDLRITKGVARYTTTFTPPAKSLPKL